ncbi:MAG: VOC family protein [Rhizobacter sp.]
MTTAAFDHLVVAARSLDEGVAWCEATLGFVPTAGGAHPLMGTHNRVFSIATPAWPRAYFEIIAIDPAAPPPGRLRWYDLDAPALQAALARGPQLIHWVLACDDIVARRAQLAGVGIVRGELLDVQRDTPAGPLRWRLTVRDDGARLADGALPTLIEWGDRHPADTLPATGVRLERLVACGVPPDARPLCAVPGVSFADDGPPLVAELATPRGPVSLMSLRRSDVQP